LVSGNIEQPLETKAKIIGIYIFMIFILGLTFG
jgi:hypothetical protein